MEFVVPLVVLDMTSLPWFNSAGINTVQLKEAECSTHFLGYRAFLAEMLNDSASCSGQILLGSLDTTEGDLL